KCCAMRWPGLNTQILLGALAGLLLGWGLGALEPASPVRETGLYVSGLIGGVFIDLLKMILIPLVFTSIAVGVANLQAHRQVHKVWHATLGFFVLSMLLAIVLALVASNIFRPGEGLQLAMFQNAMQGFAAQQLTLPEFFAQFLHG